MLLINFMYELINFTDEWLIPIPPSNLQISDEIDERVEFFGHVTLNISWDAPQSMVVHV